MSLCVRCDAIETAVVGLVLDTSIREQAMEAAIATGNERPLYRELFRQIDNTYDVLVRSGAVVPQAQHAVVVGALRAEIDHLKKERQP